MSGVTRCLELAPLTLQLRGRESLLQSTVEGERKPFTKYGEKAFYKVRRESLLQVRRESLLQSTVEGEKAFYKVQLRGRESLLRSTVEGLLQSTVEKALYKSTVEGERKPFTKYSYEVQLRKPFTKVQLRGRESLLQSTTIKDTQYDDKVRLCDELILTGATEIPLHCHQN
jgi:hypothetical protein